MKTELSKYRNYLLLVGILLFARFLVQPYVEGLQQSIDRQQVEFTKLAKVKNLVDSQTDIEVFSENVSIQRAELEASFKAMEDADSFRLAQQQFVQALFEQHDVMIDNIGWLGVIEPPETLVTIFPLEIQFKGEMSRFIQLAWELESQGKGSLIRDMSLSVRGQSEDELGFVRGRVIITFFASAQ